MKIAIIFRHTSSLLWFRMDMMIEFIELGHSGIAFSPEPEVN